MLAALLLSGLPALAGIVPAASDAAPTYGGGINLDVTACIEGKPGAHETTACKLCLEVAEASPGCDSARSGPTVDGLPTWEVRYADAAGPNIREQTVVLVTVKDGSPRLMWAHKSIDASAFPKHLQPVQDATVWRWTYSPDGKFISVTGVKTLGTVDNLWAGAAHGRRKSLEPERFYYDRRWGQFLPQ